jgi:hypothetical protein
MILKRIRLLREAHARFHALVAEGKSAEEAGEIVEAEAEAKGLDPMTILVIVSLILKLIEAFKK